MAQIIHTISHQFLFSILIAYLLGSIPTSIWLGKLLFGIDIRNYGSGNAGATNSYRVLGPKAGLMVLLFDVLKGWAALKLAFLFAPADISQEHFINYQISLGIAAVLGHVFPVFAGFKGGKGMATLIGIAIGLYPYPLLVVIGVFILIFSLTRYVSLGSILSGLAFPFIVVFLFKISIPSLVIFSIAIAIFIPLTHKKNIQRLFRGEENKLNIRSRNRNNDQ